MTVAALAFYLFAAVTVAAAAMVITARNPVHSVLFLILAFLSAAGLFVLAGAEFLAMILAIVYVGAVAVLFMFVVMMLDIDFVRVREGVLRYLPIGGAIGLVLLVELGFVAAATRFGSGAAPLASPLAAGLADGGAAGPTNTERLGQVLYTDYFYLFQAAGVVLLVAMIGAIALSLRERAGVRRQQPGAQAARLARDTVEVRKVPPGTGL